VRLKPEVAGQPLECADLLRRVGRTGEAVAAYESAIALATNGAERDYLARRRDELR
jgi:RNA polymerase sigma-70 factor, ECF subfamily